MFDQKPSVKLLLVFLVLMSSLFIPNASLNAENPIGTLPPNDWLDSMIYTVVDPEETDPPDEQIGNCTDCDIPLDDETYQQYQKPVEYPKGMSRTILPTSYDARDDGLVTSPKNQGACGSCWAFASVGAMESHLLALGESSTDLSEQQLVSCHSGMSGCCGGSSTALQFWETAGPINESCFPYGEGSTACPVESTVSCAGSIGCTQLDYRVANWHTVSSSEFKDSLYVDGPSYWRFTVYDDFSSWYNSASSGSVYVNGAGTSSVGGHAVLLIGWDDTKSAYLLKNSWGSTSGPQGDGTFWMAYSGHNHDLGFQMANFDLFLPGTGDSYEPDDSAAEANWISSGSPQTHSIAPVGDEDWVKFTLASESEVTLETSGVSGDTRMWLYDSSFGLVEFDDDDGTEWFSYIDRVCDADALPTGTYYVQVDEYFDDAEIPSYNLSFNAAPCNAINVYLPLVIKTAGAFNGDFELGHTSWTEFSSSADELITNTMPVTPHSGTWLAKFGGNDDETDQLSQMVTVPVDQTDLHYWYWVPSADSLSDYDYFRVKINGTPVKTMTLYGGTVTSGWVEDILNLSAYAGSTVTLMFEVTTDFIEPSILYLDDISFEASMGFNGDFELGHIGWTEYSSSADDLITNSMPVTPHSGSWLARFGEYDWETDQLSQVVTIPVDQTDLHYWYWIPSADSLSGWDFFYVKINGTPVKTIDLYSANVTTGWVEDVVDLSAYAGSAVNLMFEATTDSVEPSILYLDDVSFLALPPGFNSQFNGDATGWEVHSGIWYNDSDFYYTFGINDLWSSVSHVESFSNFDYQVEMWRYGSDYDANNIIIRGTPNPLGTDNRWYNYYSFQYSRDGSFSVFKRLAGGGSTALQSWVTSSAINTGNNWNTLRVVADNSNLYFYINGTLVWSGTDTSFTSGQVGISMFKDDDGYDDDILYIDWATLTPIAGTSTVTDTVSAEQQLLNEAANQNPVGDINHSK